VGTTLGPSSDFLKKYITWLTLYGELFAASGHHRNRNLLRYAPEIRSDARAVTGKWLLKN